MSGGEKSDDKPSSGKVAECNCAEENDRGYFNVTVRRGTKLSHTRLWLDVYDVAEASRTDEEIDRSNMDQIDSRDELRDSIMLNVTNALHWSPYPDQRAINWENELVLTRLHMPPSPNRST